MQPIRVQLSCGIAIYVNHVVSDAWQEGKDGTRQLVLQFAVPATYVQEVSPFAAKQGATASALLNPAAIALEEKDGIEYLELVAELTWEFADEPEATGGDTYGADEEPDAPARG